MPVSIRDVAERANVSRGTVSHVLNGRTEARIALETQERVRQAARELGYVPNQMAKYLFRGKTHLIGVVATGIINPFYAELIGASETAIAESGYRRLVDASAPLISNVRPEILSVWPVDGILMHGAVGRAAEGLLGARVEHVPVVYLDSPADAQHDTVQFDLAPAIADAAGQMIAKGHTRFGIVSPLDQFDLLVKQRYQPLYNACHTINTRPNYFRLKEDSRQSAFQLGMQIAGMPPATRPTILFCHSDHLAIGIYNGLVRRGVRAPDDIGIIGIDGISETDCMDRPLSTIKHPVDELCKVAVTMLRERIEGTVTSSPRHVNIPSVFLPRETT